MKELFSLIPGVSDILKVPVIMLATALSVAMVVVAARLLIKLLMKAFRAIFHKERT